MIHWSETMSVGVPLLDSDHRVLIGLINHLEEATENRIEIRVIVEEVLDALIAYTRFHFDREERVMAACRYPELETHHEEHQKLTREVMELLDRFERDHGSVSQREMDVFLTEWLNHHILLQDKAYRTYTERNPVAMKAAEAYGRFDFRPFDVDLTEADLDKAC